MRAHTQFFVEWMALDLVRDASGEVLGVIAMEMETGSVMILQARATAGDTGFVFLNSQLTAGPGVTSAYLARSGGTTSTAYVDNIAFINTRIGPHIRFGHRVTTADWSGVDARWTVRATDRDGTELISSATVTFTVHQHSVATPPVGPLLVRPH